MEFDIIIVGTGLAGSILARELAEIGKRVLMLERRAHIAGNTFDEVDEHGVLVQRFGPHTFHTNDRGVYEYLSRFVKMNPYKLTYRAIVKGIAVPCPFNFTSIRMLYDSVTADDLISRLLLAYPGQEQVSVFELLESDDDAIRDYAEMLFEEDFRPYTAKQWGLNPEEIDKSIIRRVPILLNDRDSYFNDEFECQPEGGFTVMVRNMLQHPLISIRLETDALQDLELDEETGRVSYQNNFAPHIIYTGALDELFGWQFGALPYRSLAFEWISLPQTSFQETAIVAYPKDAAFTRITEYTKLPVQHIPGRTVIAKEYSLPYDKSAEQGNEPYYPIGNDKTYALKEQYLQKARKFSNLTLCGRLADYQYYNMDNVVRRALDVAEELKLRL